MRARASRKPRALLRGMKILDGITGEEIFQKDSSTRYQRGMFVYKKSFDVKTTEQMQQELISRLR